MDVVAWALLLLAAMDSRPPLTLPPFTLDEAAPPSVRLDESSRRIFESLYRAFRTRVERLILSRTPAQGHSDDLVQESFCRAIVAFCRGALDPDRPIGPYLLGIAAHVAADWGRAARERRWWTTSEPIDTDGTPRPPSETDPERLCQFSLQLEALLAAELPLIREVVRRRLLGSESEREAARQLGISRRKLRVIEQRLRRELLR